MSGIGGLKLDAKAAHSHDHDIEGSTCKSHGHSHHHHEENINIRAAVVHVIGDMLQSIGVIIASIMIYVWPDAKIADPICTYLFSVLVIMTTVPVFRDCIKVLMESEPNGVDSQKLKTQISELKDVKRIDDFHIWALAGNKNLLTVHVVLKHYHHNSGENRTKKVYN